MSRVDKYKNYRDNIEKRIDDRQSINQDSEYDTSDMGNRYEDKEYYQEKIPNSRPAKKIKKKKPRKKRRWWKILLLLVLILIGIFVYLFLKGKDKAENDIEFKKADVETFNGTKSSNGATNILILGTDQRDGQSNGETRSDTIMVMQINGPDKKVKLISFMRDTLVHIPGVGTEGYTDSKINSAYTIGEQNDNQGAELLRQTIDDNFGIDMQYYALINFSSFEKVINTLFPDGVSIDAKFSTIDGQAVNEVSVPDDLNANADGSVPEQTIKVGKQKMDGRTLLNYARFRKDDEGDYGRVQRQQQVLTAIIDQVKNPATLFTGSEALGTIYGYTSTNIDTSFILSNGLGILNQARKGIERMTVPENGDWTDGYDMYYGLGLEIDYDKYIAKINDFLDQ
ncbi:MULTISPECIES: LCP family protein [unclassified Enterococcus]|uniref:LCP family protein n=1 Tax=unclassified Enterococcus TaxID=2608891 RepID=UPI001556C15C|nr:MULTISPECIES: LCP family protein [unclassified Enterococcus]MBS7577744.1 LCP family protein [Enterococcus sp. MMGLQ5-2]MBS7584062.1 LCP family protein [Enterococcus sp. MMGLQ5-1]NPD11923.1 LCP family protein [Enterococcus sp. MMGLQ5-1]NPD37574.1 LCP family protein [Enterococcus sp. MMGLQ5-2]